MPLVDVLHDGYAAYNKRDFGFVDELFAEDIEWNTPGNEAPLHGREQVTAFWGQINEQFSVHHIELVDSVESGDRLVCFVRHHFTRPDGAHGDVEAVHDWHFQGGQVVKMHEVADTMAFAQIAGLIPT